MIDIKEELKEIEEFEKSSRNEMESKYEELSKKFIGKFFKKIRNEKEYYGARDYVKLLYICSVKGRNMSGIIFNDIDISKRGFSIKYFKDSNWEMIEKEEFDELMKCYEELFHFKEILK